MVSVFISILYLLSLEMIYLIINLCVYRVDCDNPDATIEVNKIKKNISMLL